jgi:chromate reductase
MEDSSKKIHIVVINGSVRPGNYTSMASALVVDELHKNPKVAVELIDPGALNLPLPGTNPNAPGTKLLQQKVTEATGVILATPEYHGSFSSVMKLVIENLGYPSVLAGKPVALLGVAAGSIGAIKSLEHLRSVVSHVGAVALPLPVSVANVAGVFDKDGKPLDAGVERHIRSVATNLMHYIEQNLCPRVTLERILREGFPKEPAEVVLA